MNKVIKQYSIWHDFKPNKIIEVELPIYPKSDGRIHLAELGTATMLGYLSNKYDGKERHYLHEFEIMPYIYTNDIGNVLILTDIKFDKRGLIS